MTALDDLQHHWGGAYAIATADGWWSAIRRDDLDVLTADTAAGLLEKIRADYQKRPVARKD